MQNNLKILSERSFFWAKNAFIFSKDGVPQRYFIKEVNYPNPNTTFGDDRNSTFSDQILSQSLKAQISKKMSIF